MIDLEKAKRAFIEYTKNYDLEDQVLKAKVSHSLRVMEYSRRIAENLNLSKEQIDLATLIGLLHDIARFEQKTRYGTFVDRLSVDHGDLGAELLSDNEFIRKFIEDDKYDDIIKTAIRNHNKYKIEPLEGQFLTQAQIIKDADKIDIFYLIVVMYHKDPKITEESTVSDSYMEQLKEKKCVFREENTSQLDELILITSFIYDIYFDYSLKIIKDEKYIENMFKQFNFKDESVRNKIKEVIDIANDFLKDK